jgi:hypothetical protein
MHIYTPKESKWISDESIPIQHRIAYSVMNSNMIRPPLILRSVNVLWVETHGTKSVTTQVNTPTISELRYWNSVYERKPKSRSSESCLITTDVERSGGRPMEGYA